MRSCREFEHLGWIDVHFDTKHPDFPLQDLTELINHRGHDLTLSSMSNPSAYHTINKDEGFRAKFPNKPLFKDDPIFSKFYKFKRVKDEDLKR